MADDCECYFLRINDMIHIGIYNRVIPEEYSSNNFEIQFSFHMSCENLVNVYLKKYENNIIQRSEIMDYKDDIMLDAIKINKLMVFI